MSTLNDNDLFVYQEAATGNPGAVANSNRSALAEDDLFVVWGTRGGITQNWKVKAKDVGGDGGEWTTVDITPASITPTPVTQYVYCVTDIPKVNGSVPADVTYKWYQYDSASGSAGKLLLQENTSRQSNDSLVLPSSAGGKYIGCDVTYLGVTKAETSARCQVLQPAGPSATMYGLRFDETKETNMVNGMALTGDWTYSGWIKSTGQEKGGGYLAADSGRTGINLDYGTNNLRWHSEGSDYQLAGAIPQNEWVNIIVVCKDSKLEAFVNGVYGGYTIEPSSTTFTSVTIGKYTDNVFAGYMSDVYLVPSACPPTVFGKMYSQGWGPLDGSQVKENLKSYPLSPYDLRANTDQNWTSNTTASGAGFNASYPKSNIFDGTDAAGRSTETNTSQTITFGTPLNFTKSVRAYGNQTGTMQISGGQAVSTSSGGLKWYILASTPGTLNSITLTSTGGDTTSLAGIEVDGRLLVDSTVWRNSENWSSGSEGSWNDIANAFNGTVGGSSYAESNQNTTGSINFSGLTGLSNLQIYGNITSTAPTVKVNGTDVTGSFTTSGQWVDVSSALSGGALNTIDYTSTDGRFYLYAIKADGALLVDAGAQYNNSEIWSNNLTTTSNFIGAPYLGFDGNPATGVSYGSDKENAIVYSDTLTGVNRLRIQVRANTIPSATTSLRISGAGITTTSITDFNDAVSLFEIPLTSTTVSNIVVTATGGNVAGGIAMMEVNNKILVNPGISPNGLYLPFNPDATGVNYSSSTTANPPANNVWGGDPGKAFDGSTATFYQAATDTQGNTLTIDLSSYFVGQNASTVEVYSSFKNGTAQTIEYKSGGAQPLQDGWQSFNNTGDLGTIVITQGESTYPDAGFGVAAVKVDGKMLVNHYGIGKDESGNKNNVSTLNFGIGNTSQFWTKDTNGHWELGNGLLTNLAMNCYDGSFATYGYGDNNGVPNFATVIYGSPITIKNSLRLFVGTGSNGIFAPVWLDSTNVSPQLPNPGLPTGQWVTITGVNSFKQIDIGRTDGNSYTTLYAVEVDGELLINPDSVDTVLDTPMNSYSVAAQGTYGNLQNTPTTGNGTGVSVYKREYDKPYFAEFTVSGYPSGASTNYSIGASNDTPSSFWTIDGQGGIYLGNTSSGSAGFNYTNGDVIGVVFHKDTLSFYKNGEFKYQMKNDGINAAISNYYVNMNSSSQASIFTNYGQQPFQFATNNNNGTANVGSVDGPITCNLLTKEWEQWVGDTRKALLEASESRVDALEQVFMSMATEWTYGATYHKDDIVKFNCSLHRALTDNITTRSPVTANSDVWENLYIDCERTHSMNLDDLIPDEWSQEQRRAALQELLQELSENDESESY